MIRIEDEVRIGQDVSLRVLSTQGKLTLSMKPPATGTSEALVMGDLWFILGKMLGRHGLMVIFDGLLQWLNIGEWDDNGIYPPVNIQKTMENYHF